MSAPNPDAYQGNLLTLPQQLKALKEINETHWDNHLSDEQLAAVPLDSHPDQKLTEVTSLHVEFDSPDLTLRRWRDAYFKDKWLSAHWNMMAVQESNDGEGFLRLHESARQYEPGIHVVRADLTYRLGDNESIDTVREDAVAKGHHLAHGELLSIMGLNRALRYPLEDRGSYMRCYEPYLGGYENNNPYLTYKKPGKCLAMGTTL